MCWIEIALAIALFYYWRTWWVLIPVVIFVASWQYALAILLHDAQHTLISPHKRFNNLIGTWLLAAPIGSEFVSSQECHLAHHFHFGNPDRDPDYALYCFGQPSPKQSTWQVMLSFIARLIGMKVIWMLKRVGAAQASVSTKSDVSGDWRWRTRPAQLKSLLQRLFPILCAQALIGLSLTVQFGWYGYILLWALPLATLAAFFNDFRIFCEHSLIGREAADPNERLVSFISNPIERFFVAPYNMNYHAEHHLFPYVPHFNLPKLRRTIKACPEMEKLVEWRSSYIGHVIGYIEAVKHRRPGEAEATNRSSVH